MKKLLPTLLITALATACNANNTHKEIDNNINKNQPAINNIIMVVADGMGPAYVTAYRNFADDLTTEGVDRTVFDRHYVGTATTYPASVSGYITDSAAAATALATGVKTYNDAISVDVNKQPVKTVLERAKELGKKTGVVVTSQINHATPASYLSHNEYRRNYNEIADSYLDDGIKADIYLGGGWRYFIRKDRNLVEEFKQSGFHYLDNYQNLSSLPSDKPVLGLFGKTGLPWALDDTNPHRLSAMTKAAISQLENEQGFFMLVEASQVDWAGHSNDIASAMYEMDDLAKTFEFLEQYVNQHPDTLVILTADHSTGGLSIGRKTYLKAPNVRSDYTWLPEILRSMTLSPEGVAKQFEKNKLTIEQVSDLLNFELTQQEYDRLQTRKSTAAATVDLYYQTPKAERTSKYPPTVYRLIAAELKEIIDIRTNTGWGGISDSATHTGVDVPVYVIGSEKQPFSGVIDNTDIAKGIFKLLENNK
ncbi:alkaline phosphatase [Colwellia sp. 1_MG-2023]|uniref:alkaline phosphatase n=1 Tax=Colwellia sp. 1_MG-2023 TaxID=3062649 RepID=UPI0026E43B6D|nr:alkaline phosphatase [Colwellia sp. 1_MG-2023]MDO6446809.1 alkaline phosphatase [Colwellia sp. 1_MG-2023]